MSRHDPIVPAPPALSTALARYLAVAGKLFRALGHGQEGTPEVAEIRAELGRLFNKVSDDELRMILPQLAEMGRRASAKAAMLQVNDLFAAGWMPEWEENGDRDPHAWAWRRPPRRPGAAGPAGRGRRFASTGQAWNAMRREQAS